MTDNLNNGIYALNLFEKLPERNNGYAVPLACFCDIPLGMIKEHLDWYGKFGIGINRAYARSLGINPVWYVHSQNLFVNNLIRI